jgi:hypothetical protein
VTHDGTRVFYTPTSGGGVGLDTFTYTISDGNGGTDTATVSVQVVDFTLSSLSGYVYVEETGDQMKSPEEWGIGHVMVTLTGTNMRGDQVHQTAWTDGNGHYEFAGLLPNMAGEHYTLTEHHPTDFIDGAAQVGDQGGVAVDQNTIQVSVPVLGWANGATGSGNNFAEAALKPVYASVSLGDLLRSGGSTTASDRLIWSTDTAGYLQWYINGGGWDGYIPGVATPAGSNTFRVTMTFGSMQLTDTGSGQAHTAVVAGNATSTTANGSTIRKVTAAGTAYGLAPHAYAAAVQNVDETVVSSVADSGQGYTESVDDLFSQLGGLLS